jgi:hypothetical protein
MKVNNKLGLITYSTALLIFISCSEPNSSTNEEITESDQTGNQALEISAYNLVAMAPQNSSISDLMGSLMIQGQNLAVTLEEPSDSEPLELEAAVTEFKDTYDKVTNIAKKELENGWYFTAENEGMGTNYWLVSRIIINNKPYSCGTTASTEEQQSNAVSFCTSLRAK